MNFSHNIESSLLELYETLRRENLPGNFIVKLHPMAYRKLLQDLGERAYQEVTAVKHRYIRLGPAEIHELDSAEQLTYLH